MEGVSAMKILSRHRLKRTIILAAGDKLTMNYVEVDGVVRTERMTSFAVIAPEHSVRVNEAVLIECLVDGAHAIGALLIETPDTAVELKKEATAKVAVAPLRPGDRHKKKTW